MKDAYQIASEAIYDNCNLPEHRCQEIANAVIDRLGLYQEWGLLDHEDGGILYDNRGQAMTAQHLPGETLKTRWITDWQPDTPPPYCNRCGKPCQTLECLREDDQ